MSTKDPSSRGFRLPQTVPNRLDTETIEKIKESNTTHDRLVIITDGSYFREQHISTGGIIIEDTRGNEILRGKVVLDDPVTSTQTEAATILEALKLAEAYEATYILIQNDSKRVIQKVIDDNNYIVNVPDDEAKPSAVKKRIYYMIKKTAEKIPEPRLKYTPNVDEADTIAGNALQREKDLTLD